MIRTVRIGDIVGFRTFTSVIRYGEVVDLLWRGADNRPTRRDEISVRLKPDGQVVMVQRWRIAERYDHRRIAIQLAASREEQDQPNRDGRNRRKPGLGRRSDVC